jgi:hypothetical protein
MPGARQNTGQEAILNLSKKLDEMSSVIAEQATQQTSILSSLSMSQGDTGSELTKQTSILMSIDAKLDAKNSNPSVNTSEMAAYTKAFGSMAKAIVDLIEKATPEAGKNVKAFFDQTVEGLQNVKKEAPNEKAVQPAAAALGSIGSGVLEFAFFTALATPLLLLSLPGSLLFGLNIRLLMFAAGTAATPEAAQGIAAVAALGWTPLAFAGVMFLYTLVAPLAMVGAIMFGLTIRLLLVTAGVANSETTVQAINAVIGLGWGVLGFGFLMSLYILFAPTAMIGAVIFGLTVRLLLKSAGVANNQNAVDSINAVIGLGWGVIGFGFLMTLYLLFAPTAFIGAMIFGLTVRLLLLVAGVASERGIEAIKAVTKLGWGVIVFGLAMTFYLILAIPAFIGAMLFGLTVRLLLLVAGVASKKGQRAIKSVLKLGWGIIMFGLALGLYLIIGIPALLGAVLFGVTVYLISIVLKFVSSKKAKRGIQSLLKLGLAIILFGLIIYVWNKTIKFTDTLMLVASLAMIGLVVWLIGKQERAITKGSKALMKAAIAVGALAVAMIIWMKAEVSLKQVAILGATLVGLGVIGFVAGKFAKDIEKGSVALIVASGAVIALGIGMKIWMSSKVTFKDVAILGATLVAVGLIGAIAGAGPIPGFILAGSAALIVAGGAVIAVSLGMLIWMKAKVKMADVGVLGATLGMLGVEFGLFGAAAIFIGLGAVAMLATVPTLLALSAAVAIFKSTKFTKKDADIMEYTLESVAAGFMGGRMPGGIVAAIKFAAGAAARAALVAISAVAFIPAGISLIMISGALKRFKESKFDKKDADNMEFAIGAVIRAFSLIGDSERKKKMGITATYLDIILGIAALANAGDTLANLAKGVQEWANLTVTEYEVVNAGTKDAKIVPKGKVKLSKSDFDNAAYGMATVIKSIAEPFAQVGRLEMGLDPGGNKTSGREFLSVFGGGFVSKGITALGGAGNILSELAKSTQQWSNLKVAEYEVVGAGTKDAKLVIKGYNNLTQDDIKKAIENQAMVVTSVGTAFATVGKLEDGEPPSPLLGAMGQLMHGIFGGRKVSKGVKALEKAGNILSELAKTTQQWAQLSVAEFEVVDGGSKDAKLVIKGYKRLTQDEIKQAIENQAMVVTSVGTAFATVGKLEDGEPPSPLLGPMGQLMHGIFGGKKVTKGVNAIEKTGNILSSLAGSVQNWANLKVSEFEVVNPGTKDAKLVIKGLRTMSLTEVLKAGFYMSMVVGMVGKVFADIGRLDAGETSDDSWLNKIFGKQYVAKGVKALSGAGNVMSSLATAVGKWSKLSVAEWEVKDGKLVLVGYHKITEDEIQGAMTNMRKVALATAQVFADIGSGLGVPGYKYVTQEALKKGIDFVQPASNALKSMADAIASMLKLEFIENEVKNGKIVPKSVRKITPADLVKAGINMSTLALFMAGMMAKIGAGDAKDEQGRTVREEDIKRGIKFVSDVSSPVRALAETISKLASMEVVENEVRGGKVVPGKVTKLDPTKIAMAGINLDLFVQFMAWGLIRAGKKISASQADIDKAIEILPEMGKVLNNLANPLKTWGEIKDFDKTMGKIETFYKWIFENFDPKTNQKLPQADKYFKSFATNAKVLADTANGVKTFADNADKVAKSMKEITTQVNAMDLKKLTLTNSMFNAIAMMSKNPEAMAKAIAASMNKSFEELIKALKELASANTPAGGGGGNTGTGNTGTGNTGTDNKTKDKKTDDKSKDKKSEPAAGVQKVHITNWSDFKR